MTFRVETTKTAETEVHRILSWLADRSPQGTIAWYDAWKEAMEFLSVNPYSASLAPENSDHEEVIRHWSFKTARGHSYRTLFIIREQVVYITNVRGKGRHVRNVKAKRRESSLIFK